jgi:hypothetical protein
MALFTIKRDICGAERSVFAMAGDVFAPEMALFAPAGDVFTTETVLFTVAGSVFAPKAAVSGAGQGGGGYFLHGKYRQIGGILRKINLEVEKVEKVEERRKGKRGFVRELV